MKKVCAALAILVAGASLSSFAPRPSPARPVAAHDCCCAVCPGPGLCPCDPARPGDTACVRASDERPSDVGPAPGIPLLKLACEVPGVPILPAFAGRRPAEPGLPQLPPAARSLDKVPISFA